MHCFFIDLASHDGLLACADDQTIIASEPVDHRIGDHELVPLFEKTLDQAKWKAADLTHVACIIGPGGFMSLRVAVAFANTLIHQLRVPGAGVHLSDVCFARVTSPPRPPSPLERGEKGGEVDATKDFLWLHSTKKHELFVRGFGSFSSLWPEAAHVTVEAFMEKLPLTRPSPAPRLRSGHPPPEGEGKRNKILWTGELIPEHEALFKDKELQPLALQPLMDVLPAFLVRQHYEQKLLEPWYGRGW
ncbi:MAG: hypothetical protein PHX87_00440 [Candidatus Peribacteraceae bacterium]|nr:hypothetical protein [Candidatus Peribacteraceae bacterium]MDD5741876.1 hypothetical protein [Candidatus Peribacteraceae bacterium]